MCKWLGEKMRFSSKRKGNNNIGFRNYIVQSYGNDEGKHITQQNNILNYEILNKYFCFEGSIKSIL